MTRALITTEVRVETERLSLGSLSSEASQGCNGGHTFFLPDDEFATQIHSTELTFTPPKYKRQCFFLSYLEKE